MHLFDILFYMSKIHSVYLVTFRNGPLIEKVRKIENIDIFCFPAGYIPNQKVLKAIKTVIFGKKIQIIHAHQPKAIFIATIIKRKYKVPLVSTIHSQPIDHALVCKGLRKIAVYLFHSFIDYLGQYNSDKCIFVSQAMFDNSKFPDKSVLIYNWFRSSIKKTNIIEKHLQNKKKITFVCCGSVTYRKGFDVLLEFVQKMIAANYINFEIKVAGGIDENFVNNLRAKYTSEVFAKIKLLGYVEEISFVYESADFFVLFSRAETFGLVYVEGMAFGLPVIASNLPVSHEIIPIENCISNNLDDAVNFVKTLLENNSEYEKISQQNQEWVIRNFSFENSMKKLKSVYKELL